MADDFESRIEYQLQVFASAQSLVPIADAKAGAIMAANLAFVAAVFRTNDFMMTIKHLGSHAGKWALVLVVLFFGCTIASVVSALMVIFPRFGPTKQRTSTPNLTYFRDIVSHDGPEGYHHSVLELSSEEILKEMCFQSHVIAKILVAKYTYTRTALIALVASFLFWIAFLITAFRL